MKVEEIEQLRSGDVIARDYFGGQMQAVVEEVTPTHVIARIGQQKAWLVKDWGLADFRRVEPKTSEPDSRSAKS